MYVDVNVNVNVDLDVDVNVDLDVDVNVDVYMYDTIPPPSVHRQTGRRCIFKMRSCHRPHARGRGVH